MDLLLAVDVCAARQQGLATRRQLQEAGLARSTVSRALADRRLLEVRPGVLARRPLPALPAEQVRDGRPHPDLVLLVRAALLSLGPSAAAGRQTAALLRGWELLEEPRLLEVDVSASRSRAQREGVELRRLGALGHVDVEVLAGTDPLRLADPVSTVLDAALGLSLAHAVALADSALRLRHVTKAELRTGLRSRRGWPGAAHLRRVLAWVDPGSGSVLESLLRVLLLENGLGGFVTQYEIRDRSGRRLLRADFCWPQLRLVVETDGRRFHDGPVGARDRRTGNELERDGWRLLRFTWAEVVHEPEYVLRTIAACLVLAA